MKQEDKELLLKDLCSRLPYGIKVKISSTESPLTVLSINTNGITWVIKDTGYPFEIDWENCKPFLFPLSSITEEQHKEFYDKYCWSDGGDNFEMDSCSHYYALEKFDWLLKNHFDYRGLIEKGLAIDATNLNIY